MALSIDSRLRMNDGNELPVIGLGTWQIADGAPVRKAVLHALKVGYRLVDTASLYANEKGVGEAVREAGTTMGIGRGDIFVTTKLWNSDHGRERSLAAFEKSLSRLGLDHVDRYLIHWPVEQLRNQSWDSLVDLKKAGKVRSIGVSNYTIRHLKGLFAHSDVRPTVNQVELNPFLLQKELLEFCRKEGIVVEAYCPLGRGAKLDDPTLRRVATEHGKTPAQVMLRWCLEKGVVPIPKSENERRIEENAAVFDFALSGGEMRALDGLDVGHRECWDPGAVR